MSKKCCHPELIVKGNQCPCPSLICSENCPHFKEESKRHPHADLIIAWANGAEIELKDGWNWREVKYPCWIPQYEYRIKVEPKPDIVFICEIKKPNSPMIYSSYRHPVPHSYMGECNSKLTFDGETGKLKSIEMI